MEQTVKILPESAESVDRLVARGENQLLAGRYSQALNSFAQAEELLEGCGWEFYYRMGLTLFEFGSEEGNEEALLLASKKFKTASALNPDLCEIYQAWGNALTLLGQRYEEHHFFLSAKEKFEYALGRTEGSAELFWDYAAIWYHLATHSGEAYDYQRALQSFKRAKEECEEMPSEFWIDYGTTALALSTIIHDPKQIVRAVNCFKRAVAIDSSCFDSQCSLAEALDALYSYSHDDEHFSQAHKAYGAATGLDSQDAQTWLQWAQLLLKSARQTGDHHKLRLSLEKCHRAYACNPEIPLILATWAEALAWLGQMTERIDLIYEAENKIAEALETDEQDPALWHSFGICMQASACYFNDCEYHYLAIEKFQNGLSIDRTYDPLWHQLARSYTAVGTLEGSVASLSQSLKFYEKALHFRETGQRHVDYAEALAKIGELTHQQTWLEQAIYHFEVAFAMQKDATYLHPDWLFQYATTLDTLGDFHEDRAYYTKAIEILSHVIMVDPEFPGVHHRIAQAYSHLGELCFETEYFYRCIHHLRLGLKREEDNDALLLDWGVALINLSQHTPPFTDVEQLLSDAKDKLTLAAKLGNACAYYQLSCLLSLTRQYDEALLFLQKAEQWGALPPMEELLRDDWLDNLRETEGFQQFLSEHPHLSEDR